MQLYFFLFSRATDIARSFRLKVQLHRLIHIGKWTKLIRQVTLKSSNLCGSGRIFALPLPQKKDRLHCFRFHIPGKANIELRHTKPADFVFLLVHDI